MDITIDDWQTFSNILRNESLFETTGNVSPLNSTGISCIPRVSSGEATRKERVASIVRFVRRMLIVPPGREPENDETIDHRSLTADPVFFLSFFLRPFLVSRLEIVVPNFPLDDDFFF